MLKHTEQYHTHKKHISRAVLWSHHLLKQNLSMYPCSHRNSWGTSCFSFLKVLIVVVQELRISKQKHFLLSLPVNPLVFHVMIISRQHHFKKWKCMQKCIFALFNLSVCTRSRCTACVPYVVVVLYFHRHIGVFRSYRCHCLCLVCSGKITTCVHTINTHSSKRSDTPNSLVISALYYSKVFLVIR